MNINEQLVAYLDKQIGNSEDIIKFAKNNALYYSMAYLLGIDIEKQFYYKTNKLRYEVYFKSLAEIRDSFSVKNISAIYFKGMTLANRLYDKPQKRYVGDIDIFVNRRSFPIALIQLIKLGYVFRDENTFYNEHHIVLIKENVTVELHKNIFNPRIGVDEKYLLANTEKCEIMGNTIMTFSITASLLHLIYHLYMDTWLTSCSLYSVLINRNFPKTKRFLYRAYEISLFSEKYFDKINWKDIEKDVSTQKLRVIFKKMIFDILKIFPEAFPQSFVDTVCKINYIEDERDQIYKYFIDTNVNSSDDFDTLLSNYIDDNWEARREKNIYRKVSETFLLIKESLDETKQDLNCVIETERTTEGLKIVFKVSSDDFCISEIDNYDTQASDGVHLLLCGTEKYSYNSIFLFPKQINGEIRVVVCDVLNNRNSVLTDNLIKAEFSKTETDYTITAILSNEFLKENNLNSYLYMGLVISDCSSETHRRKNQLILSEDDSQWYNPTYFAKIYFK